MHSVSLAQTKLWRDLTKPESKSVNFGRLMNVACAVVRDRDTEIFNRQKAALQESELLRKRAA